MFEHSIKVPRLYKTAAKIARQVKEDGSSLKQLVYEKKHPNVKALYALVLQTLRNEDNLNAIIRHTQILTKENRLDPWLARVLITELLWGKKKLPGESKPIKTIISYQDEFLKDFTPEKTYVKKKKVNKPKYVRINTLKITVEDAIDNFRNDGMSLVRCGDGSDYSAFLATSASLSEEQFMVDTIIKDLLIFSPGTQFYDHKLYKSGCFVLQDKASCLAPFLLNPSKGATVLDMCAAPGMKCMQIAAMVGKTGKVFAVERDQRRYETLKSLLTTADASNVTTINKDVLTLTDSDIPNVEYILVDPSCSGSGILDRIEFEDERAHCNESRLQKLAGFQITILRHALNNFKSVKHIVYSTCSIFPQENEQVVQQAITTTPDFKLVPLNETLKEKWYNFGSNHYNIGPRCLYSKPEIDRTNGFFIAVFERLKEGETNEFFIRRVHRSSECDQNEGYEQENNDKASDNENINRNEEHDIKKRKKKKKHHNNGDDTANLVKNDEVCVEENVTNENDDNEDINLHSKVKKRKANDNISNQKSNNDDVLAEQEPRKSKKKKNKNKRIDPDDHVILEDADVTVTDNSKCSKKSKRKACVESYNAESQVENVKNKHTEAQDLLLEDADVIVASNSNSAKRKRKDITHVESCNEGLEIENLDSKKCKKKHKDKEKSDELVEYAEKKKKKKNKKDKNAKDMD